MREKKRFTITSLGCRTNQYEAEALRSQLHALGLEEATVEEKADFCIINSCAVTDGAEASSRHTIYDMKRKHPDAEIVVTGCMASKDKDSLLALGGITHVIPNAQKESLVQILFPEQPLPEFSISSFEGRTRAFVKIQDGCNSFCSYCIIPYVRGRSRSRSIPSITQEVKALLHNGFKEIVLTGINVGDFDGGDKKATLSDLVQELDSLPHLERLRISSIDPDEVDDRLIQSIVLGKHTAPSMHIVLQSGSNSVLKRMRRKYTKQIFFDTIEKLLQAQPNCTFTTDVIVGFPGETDRDFEETVEVLQKVRFAKVHIFPFSIRKGTLAEKMTPKVPESVVKERKKILERVALDSAFQLRERFLNTTTTLLTETSKDGKRTFGHTPHFFEVTLDQVLLPPNQLVEVRLRTNTDEGFIGELV